MISNHCRFVHTAGHRNLASRQAIDASIAREKSVRQTCATAVTMVTSEHPGLREGNYVFK